MPGPGRIKGLTVGWINPLVDQIRPTSHILPTLGLEEHSWLKHS